MTGTDPDNVDPTGDLLLLVGSEGSEQKLIRVSSKVISLASRVFAIMLGPRFAEGHALSDQKSFTTGGKPALPLTVALPEDDPEAMSWFCDAVHLRQHLIPSRPFPLLIEKIAILCDKHDAALALTPWSELWLSNIEGSKEGGTRFSKLLWISHAFGNQHAFWKISRQMMRNYTEDELLKEPDEIKNTSLPGTVIDSINKEREDDLN